jgi:3-oxoacyl-[acyl-carrier protein] reductase
MTITPLLQDKTIIVTGASTGIGQAFAFACAEQGANVVVADMNGGDDTVEAIQQKGGQATFIQTDVANEASVHAMAAHALKTYGRIGGLVNNAAYFREVKLTPFEDIESEIWDRAFDVNVKGV